MNFETLADLYTHSVAAFAERTATGMYEQERLTYADFDGRVSEVRRLLLEAGVGPGDKVALLSGNMPGWPVSYFAAVTAGMVVVPILPDFSADEIETILVHCEAKALLVSDKLYSRLARTTIDRMRIVLRTKNLKVIARQESQPAEAALPRPDDVAAIVYTSGTTSRSKGVMLTHRNLCRQIAMAYELFPVGPDDVFLSILPLSHTYECSIGMLYPFACGASVVYLDRPPTAGNLMPALRDVRPTIMLSVPLIIEKIYKTQVKACFTSSALSRALYARPFFRRRANRMVGRKLLALFGGRLRFFGIGGAKLDTATEQFLLDARFPYAIGYGLTETAPLIAGAPPGMVRLGSTGSVLQGIEIRLEGVDPATGEGEIVVHSPSTMKGYYKNPSATAEVFTADGWFRTKDLGRLDADGYLYIKGRLNNVIVGPSGENIYPEEIESVLNGHALVTDSIVRQEHGRLVALVRFDHKALEHKYHDLKENLSHRMEELKAEILQYVNRKVSRFSRVASVEEQKKEFEKTPTHKIKRYLYAPGKRRKPEKESVQTECETPPTEDHEMR